MIITPSMGLKIWNLLGDFFSHNDNSDNLTAIDGHDHTNGKGVPVPTGGIANGAVTALKVASGTLTSDQVKISGGSIGTFQSGLASALPTPAYRGRQFYGTDTAAWYIDTSTRWVPLNVAQTNITVNTTAIDGQWLNAIATGLTITLPAPTPGAQVGVTAAATSTSATNSTTITATGGAKIVGAGAPGITSFPLGVRGAYVLLQCNGNNWFVVSGILDSGWIAMTPSVGNINTPTGYFPAAARFIGDVVQFRGVMRNAAGGGAATIVNGTPWATINVPAAFTLSENLAIPSLVITPTAGLPGISSAVVTSIVAIAPSGTVSALGADSAVGTLMILDGITFSQG